MEESLARTPFSEVSKLLEVFKAYGIPYHLLSRLRADRDFAQKVCEMLLGYYRDNPGDRFVFQMDYSKSRIQLWKEMRERHYMVLREDIIRAFEPKNTSPESGQGHLIKKEIPLEDLEVYRVTLFEDMTEKEALAILDFMGLETVTIEEAMTFALIGHGALSYDFVIEILGSKWLDPLDGLKLNRLSLGITMGGRYDVSASHFPLRDRTRVLVKRKKDEKGKE